MQVSIDEVNATRRKLAVEVPVEEVAAEFDRAFGRVQKQAKLKGFRPGRAPRSVVEKLFGDQVRADVLSHLIEHSYSDAVKQAGLRPVGPPEIVPESIESGKPLRYSATIDVLPKIEIGDTNGLAAKRPRREVTETDVDRAIEQLRESLAELRPVEGREEAREGDFVSIDYAGFVDSRPMPDGKRENRLFELGKGMVPPEFERALVGAKVGESKTVEVSYPTEHADASIAGKTARFDLSLRAIREKILPAADDDLAKEHGECPTLAELARQASRANRAIRFSARATNRFASNCSTSSCSSNPFEVPVSLVDRQVNAFVEDLLDRVGAQRAALETRHGAPRQASRRVSPARRAPSARRARARRGRRARPRRGLRTRRRSAGRRARPARRGARGAAAGDLPRPALPARSSGLAWLASVRWTRSSPPRAWKTSTCR